MHSISGYVSKAGAGVGRSDSEKQFLFVNRRPVEVPRVNRLFNEVGGTVCRGLGRPHCAAVHCTIPLSLCFPFLSFALLGYSMVGRRCGGAMR